MNVPLLSKQPEGICIVCKGFLSPNHEHVYVDTVALKAMEDALTSMVEHGCLAVLKNGELISGHPFLSAGFMWYPVPITHVGQHDECAARVPHHHCEITDYFYRGDGRNEVPNTDGNLGKQGTPTNEEGRGAGDTPQPNGTNDSGG